MVQDNKLWIAQADRPLYLLPGMANRHGLIAGATGTGKTVTMKVMAEAFSDIGVPVFFSDVKGDLSGMCEAGTDSPAIRERLNAMGIEDFPFKDYPTRFWDIFGENGHPVRVTVSGMGPVLISRLLGLTEIQSGVLNIVFKVADDHGLLLLDFKDLRAILQYVGDNRAEFTTMYGNVSAASIGAIQRALLTFEQEGGECVFGEPELDITDWIRTDTSGRGYINILSSARLIQSPMVYATFLMWMLSELFEKLPEIGDPEKPRMVFFFDEAHLLFEDAPKSLVQKIEQVVKLIRSKGVGVYFVTQQIQDIPGDILAQLSNRVQHGLRAYTPAEQKNVRAAAQAFRDNEGFDEEEVLLSLGTGEALVSFLDEKGIPMVVEKASILPPQSKLGEAGEQKISSLIKTCEFDLKYRQVVDRESAYEIIQAATIRLEEERIAQAQAAEEEKARKKAEADAEKARLKAEADAEKARLKAEEAAEKARIRREQAAAKAEEKARAEAASAISKTAQRAASSAMSSVTRSVSTNLVNSLTGGRKSSAGTIAKRAATTALSSVMRNGASAILRGLFGNKK